MPTTPTFKQRTAPGGKTPGEKKVKPLTTPKSNPASEAGRDYFDAKKPAPVVPAAPSMNDQQALSQRVSPGLGTDYNGAYFGYDTTRTNPRPQTAPGMSTEPGGSSPASQGFSSRYDPLALSQGILYDNPDVLAADILAEMGITNPEMIAMLADSVDLGYALQLIMGGGEAGAIPGVGDITDQVAEYAQGLMTPGAASLDPNMLMDLIMSADPNSALGKYLTLNGPDAVNNLIMSAMSATTNPYYQNATKGALGESRRNYYSDFASDPTSVAKGYYDALRGGQFGGYFGGQ